MKNNVFLLRSRISSISMWSFLKWVGIGIVVIYIATATGMKLAQDVAGLHVSYHVSINLNSDGILSPLARANQ